MSFVATAVKQKRLEQLIAAHAPLVIAYSGGVDSTYLLAIAAKSVGDRCLGVIADSPSLPREALSNAVALARDIGAKLEIIETREMDNPSYAANPPNRCYFCKVELFATLELLAGTRGFAAIAYGENADDARHVRPGRRAAAEFRVLAPLKEVGLTKSEIRSLSHGMNLPTAHAPAQPCLSSRIPYGTPVTPAALAMVERAEMIVRGFGFRVFRVRHVMAGDRCRARIEILPEEMPRLAAVKEAILLAVRQVGYEDVWIDPRGYGAFRS